MSTADVPCTIDQLLLLSGQGDLSATESEGSVEFHVTDEGDGFSVEMQARGFERFAHTRSAGGTGLGLSIVAAVAKAHAGSTGMTNRPTGGSDVWIRLPILGTGSATASLKAATIGL